MSEPIKLHDLRPAPGARRRPGRASVAARAPRVRPPVAAPRAPRPARTSRATFEGGQMPIHMRLPKLKGFKNRFRTAYEVVNVGDINRLFPDGGDDRRRRSWWPRARCGRTPWSRCSATAS